LQFHIDPLFPSSEFKPSINKLQTYTCNRQSVNKFIDIYIYTCRCSQQFHRFIIVDTWNHSTISDFRNRGEESREKEQLQGKETEETGCICLQTDKAGEGNRGAGEEDIQTLGGDRRGGASGDEDEETGEEEHDPRGRARRGGRRPAGSSVAGGSCQAGRRLAGGICFQASSAAGGTCFPAEVEVEVSTTFSPLLPLILLQRSSARLFPAPGALRARSPAEPFFRARWPASPA